MALEIGKAGYRIICEERCFLYAALRFDTAELFIVCELFANTKIWILVKNRVKRSLKQFIVV